MSTSEEKGSALVTGGPGSSARTWPGSRLGGLGRLALDDLSTGSVENVARSATTLASTSS